MSEALFREKNMGKMKSPEDLNDYVRVSNPGVWLLLVSVVVLLLGVCIWGIFGHIDSTAAAEVCVRNGEASCCVTDERITSVTTDMVVQFADTEASITAVRKEGEQGYLCTMRLSEPVSDGVYEGRVILDSVRTMHFVWN